MMFLSCGTIIAKLAQCKRRRESACAGANQGRAYHRAKDPPTLACSTLFSRTTDVHKERDEDRAEACAWYGSWTRQRRGRRRGRGAEARRRQKGQAGDRVCGSNAAVEPTLQECDANRVTLSHLVLIGLRERCVSI